MSALTKIFVQQPGSRAAAYADWLQMLTGAGLVLFMWSHMCLVASVNFGAEVMNAIANFFEVTYMAQIGGPLIGCTLLLHFVLAARKIPFRSEQQVTIWRHSKMLHHMDTWLWMVQVITAMIILIMGFIHMWVVLTDLPITAAKSAARIQGGFWLGFYIIFVPMVQLHVVIGLYRILVKWGVVRRRGRNVFRVFLAILIGLILLENYLTVVQYMRFPIPAV